MPYASNRGAAPIMRRPTSNEISQTSALEIFPNPALGGLLPLLYIAFYFSLLFFIFLVPLLLLYTYVVR